MNLCPCQADDDMVKRWLASVRLERYYQLFADAGYDLPTVSRMTPEVHLNTLYCTVFLTPFNWQDNINVPFGRIVFAGTNVRRWLSPEICSPKVVALRGVDLSQS